MRVKCLAQEHNTVPRPGLELGPFNPEGHRASHNDDKIALFLLRTISFHLNINRKFVDRLLIE